MQRAPLPCPLGAMLSTQKRELSTIPAWASSRLVASNCGNVFTSIVGPVTGKEPRAADDIEGRGNRQNVGRPQEVEGVDLTAVAGFNIPLQTSLERRGAKTMHRFDKKCEVVMRRGWNSECLHRHCSASDAFGTIARPSATNENMNPILSCVAAESGLPHTKRVWTADSARRMH